MYKNWFIRETFCAILFLFLLGGIGQQIQAQQAIFADDWGLKGDGVTDDQAALKKLFHSLKAKHGTNTVIFSPKTYYLGCNWTNTLIEIPSHCTVLAYGSSFLFPTNLPVPKPTEYSQQHIFEDSGVTNFMWRGGTFIGFAFDPFHAGGYKQNGWLPQQGVILFRVSSLTNSPSEGLALMDMSVIRNGAAVIFATGESQGLVNGSNDSVGTTDRFVDGVQIVNCRFDQCGSFWWDYGWLWQISTWATNYPSDLVEMADFFLPNIYKFTNLSTTAGSPAITVAENAPIPRKPIDASDNYTVSFYGTNLPNEIVRGKSYYLRDVNSTNFSVSKSYLGPAIVFGSSVTNFSMFDGMQAVYYNYSLPPGSGFSGPIALFDCKNIWIVGNTISSLGDTTRFLRCTNENIIGNVVTGARMAGLNFPAFCSGLNILGNYIDGGDGSRCVDLGSLNSDVLIRGNIFTNGGRGCISYGATNLTIQDNVFANNVNKDSHDWNLGRRHYATGDWELDDQIAFVSRNNAGFSNVVFEGNVIFNSSPVPLSAVNIYSNPDQFVFSNNLFTGTNRTIQVTGQSGSTSLRFDARVGTRFQVNYGRPGGSKISSVQGPAGYSFSLDGAGNALLRWTPGTNDAGTTNQIILQQVLAGSAVTNFVNITVIVSPSNLPPTIAPIPVIYGTPGTQSSFQVNAQDANSTTNGLTYALMNAPTNMSIDPQSGLITWSPDTSDYDSTYTPVVAVTDSSNPPLSALLPMRFASILAANLSCTISSNGLVRLGGDSNSPNLLWVQSSQSVTNISPISLNGSGFIVDPTTNRPLPLNLAPTFYSGIYVRRAR